MCYNVVSATLAKIKYATHRGDGEEIKELEEKLKKLTEILPPMFHISGFAHPHLLAYTNDEPMEPRAFQWGLVPSWVKDSEMAKSISNQTLNARSESIFEKPAFRNAAKYKRCLVYLDAFYEHHHANRQTYPFHIAMKDGTPMAVAGLWDEWTDRATGEVLRSVSIVTCKANFTLSRIHNNPKNNGPRMPVILSKENQDTWLVPVNTDYDKMKLLELAVPFDDELLEYYTVRKLTGKGSVGNVPEAEDGYEYKELQNL